MFSWFVYPESCGGATFASSVLGGLMPPPHFYKPVPSRATSILYFVFGTSLHVSAPGSLEADTNAKDEVVVIAPKPHAIMLQ